MSASRAGRQIGSVSVGIPSHNQGQFLAEALDGLLHQTRPPDEIVVSDDSSSDETAEILERYRGRIRVIHPPRPLPMVDHFNFVAQNMTGDWFAVLGGDDIAEPRFVEILSDAASHHPDAALIRGGWLLVSQTGQTVGHRRLWTTATVTRPPQTFLQELLGPKACLSAVLFRRAAWSAAGGFPTSLRHSFDWGLYLRLSAVGSFVTTHQTVVCFRTGYPVGKAISRLVDKAHDEREVALELVPMMATVLGLGATPTMRRAADQRLASILSEAADAVDPDVRARIVAELRPLAATLGRERALDAFAEHRLVRKAMRVRGLERAASVINAQAHDVGERFIRLGRS